MTPSAQSAPVERVDPLTGATVWIAGARQGRPNLPPSTGCPFCPGGLEAPSPYDVRWFVNRWPPMPGDRCEIVLYTSRHDATFWSLGPDGAARVVDLWAERTASIGARPDVAYVLVFENRGTEVGATIPHPHGQIYALDAVPPAALAELDVSACPLCISHAGADDRLVAEAGGWRATVPFGARWPYEMLLAPEAHVPDLPSLDRCGRNDLAALLVDVLGRLDRLFSAPMPYMLWFHQRPFGRGAWPTAHLHAEIAPYFRSPGTPRYVAAGEQGSGVFFNPVAPEKAAADLRSA